MLFVSSFNIFQHLFNVFVLMSGPTRLVSAATSRPGHGGFWGFHHQNMSKWMTFGGLLAFGCSLVSTENLGPRTERTDWPPLSARIFLGLQESSKQCDHYAIAIQWLGGSQGAGSICSLWNGEPRSDILEFPSHIVDYDYDLMVWVVYYPKFMPLKQPMVGIGWYHMSWKSSDWLANGLIFNMFFHSWLILSYNAIQQWFSLVVFPNWAIQNHLVDWL